MRNYILFALLTLILGYGVFAFAHGGRGYYGGHMMGGYYGDHMGWGRDGDSYCGGYYGSENDKINVKYEKTKNGMTIVMTSKDKEVVQSLHKRADYMEAYK